MITPAPTPQQRKNADGEPSVMTRRLLNLLTALSLLLSVAVAALWVRSYVVSDIVLHGRTFAHADSSGSKDWTARSNCGRMTVQYTSFTGVAGHPFRNRWLWDWAPYPPEPGADAYSPLERLGISWTWERYSPQDALLQRSVTLPLWLLTALSATIPAIRLVRRMWRTHAAGLCPTCGYDLRASPNKCPECGSEPGPA